MIPTYNQQQNHNNNQSLGAIEANFDLGGELTLPQQTQNLASTNTPTVGGGPGTAQNLELNKRLAEMKAKLAALKNQKQ
jgi:hypothetical protein